MHDSGSLGQQIKERRRALDLTQDELARRVGCAVITIKKLEADALRPSKQVAARLASALAIPAVDHEAFVRLARALPGGDAGASSGAPAPPATPTDPVLRGYELRERIGAGGFGVVYRAVQSAVGRDVAIKVIHPHYADQPDFVRRFEAEAQLVARLEHPHIVPLYDYWRDASGAYLVMRWVRGGNLNTALQQGAWSPERSVRFVEQIGTALAVAHRRGVVHRDVKPANILLDTDSNAYLADFGIAKDVTTTPAEPTLTGAIVGSPAYLSPEQLRNEPVTPLTDIYSLGVVLFELLTGVHPFAGLPLAERIERQLHAPLPSLPDREHPAMRALDAVVQRATAKRLPERYPDLPQLLADLRHAVAPTASHQARTLATDADNTTRAAAPLPTDNPYKGLHAFQEADADVFFGRAALTQRLLGHITRDGAEGHFLAVVGPSGSGKSSVVRAGLVPALRRGVAPHTRRWFIVELVPGTHPLEELEAALLRIAINPPPSLLEQLERDERGLLRAVKRVLPGDESVELVLVIDQFEELWTLVADEATRAHLLASLVAAVTAPRSRLRLVVTLRADFYDRPLHYAALSELLRHGTELVGPLAVDELRAAVERPAAAVGVSLEPRLADAILADVIAQPVALPLVQYALTELFERRDGARMTLAQYREQGGVVGALARRAESLFSGLDASAQAVARQVFLRLIAPGENSDDTRRRVLRAELVDAASGALSAAEIDPNGAHAAVEAVLDTFGIHRLLTFDRDPLTRGPTVEVAHEALIRSWDRLRGWLDASREALHAQRRLQAAADEWQRNARDTSFLASGARLTQFVALHAAGDVVLTPQELVYLQESVAQHEWQQAQERTQREILAASLRRSEALRLAAEANRLVLAGGNTELIALLALHSVELEYSPQGHEALAAALELRYPLQRFEHAREALWGVAFSPGGSHLLTGCQDHLARLWDVASGECLQTFAGHNDVVYCVAFSPDERHVLTGGYDATARLWDVATGQCVQIFRGHTEKLIRVAFSPDGRSIATASEDESARLWDVASGAVRHVLLGHTGWVHSLTFAPNGETLLTGGADGTARLWDVATGAQNALLRNGGLDVWSVAFAPNGEHLCVCDTAAHIWDVRDGRWSAVCVGHTDIINGIAFSPDGRTLLTGCQDRTARLWDVATGAELERLSAHNGFVWDVDIARDGQSFVTASFDGTALVWERHPEPLVPHFEGHSGGVVSVAWSPDGTRVATGGIDNVARVCDADTGATLLALVGHTSVISRVAYAQDGRSIVTASNDYTARLWDANTGAEVRVFAGHTSGLTSAALAPDGRKLVTGGFDFTARLWDVATGAELRALRHEGEVFDVAWFPDGERVLTGAYDKTARVWDSRTGVALQSFALPDGAASVSITPDGQTVITGSWDGSLRFWDVATGRERGQGRGHSSTIWKLAALAYGDGVLSASADDTARLWSIAEGVEQRRFTGHASGVMSVAASPDGKQLITGSMDGTARLWHLDEREAIGLLRRRLLRDFTGAERAQYGIDRVVIGQQ